MARPWSEVRADAIANGLVDEKRIEEFKRLFERTQRLFDEVALHAGDPIYRRHFPEDD